MTDGNPIFVTDDSAIHKGKLHPADLEMMTGPFRKIEAKELEELAKAACERFNAYRLFVREHLTKDQAEFIRNLRVDQGYSWRSVASTCYDQQWPRWLKWAPPTNQIMGMALCERAAELFNENYTDAPWN